MKYKQQLNTTHRFLLFIKEIIHAEITGRLPIEHGVDIRKRMGDLRIVGETEKDHQVGQFGRLLGVGGAAKAGNYHY